MVEGTWYLVVHERRVSGWISKRTQYLEKGLDQYLMSSHKLQLLMYQRSRFCRSLQTANGRYPRIIARRLHHGAAVFLRGHGAEFEYHELLAIKSLPELPDITGPRAAPALCIGRRGVHGLGLGQRVWPTGRSSRRGTSNHHRSGRLFLGRPAYLHLRSRLNIRHSERV